MLRTLPAAFAGIRSRGLTSAAARITPAAARIISNSNKTHFNANITRSFSTDSSESHPDFASVSKVRASTGIDDAKTQIQKDISTHEVFLYMKGSPAQPRCGFSANVVKILNAYPGVKFGSRDVLEDEYVREAIKQFSDWPTLPQLFVKGEFVGGSDIVGNMYKSGELDKLLGASPAAKQQ